MERKGGCCLAPRYAAAAAGQQAAGAAWQMGRIMLKFRPIAPKPAAMSPGPTPAPAPVVGTGTSGRGKRKAVGGAGGRRRGRQPKKAAAVAPAPSPPGQQQAVGNGEKEKSLPSRSSSSSGMTSVDSSSPPTPPPLLHQLETLPLMPVLSPTEDEAAVYAATEPEEPACLRAARAPQSMPPRARRPLAAPASWVTVEEVTGTWRDGEASSSAACVGSGAAADDTPAFVSDLWGRVTWRNAAFGRLSADDDGDEAAAVVALAGALPAWGSCAGFTCRVRVPHYSSPRRVGSSVVAPCDVWRLDAAGCYLWRLDLQAALILGSLR